MGKFAERVARGAALLDEKAPGWDERIDLDSLDLSSECRCILGQRFGDYEDGVDALFRASDDDPADYGFDLRWGYGADFPALTAEWCRLVQARRERAFEAGA